MQDTQKEVEDKIKKAFCDPGVVQGNPILNYTKHIIFGRNNELLISRKPQNGGDRLYTNYEELESDYAQGLLHPGDLKPSVAAAINAMLEPVREHFRSNPKARALFEKVESFKVTR
jgi:tyrosyl-tRNA synthetase